jgi:nicotinamide riboside kinase
MGQVVAIVGAESTGKTTLAEALVGALRADGHSVAFVAEYLREFCDVTGRTPRVDEQQAIADEQTRRIADAAATHDLVIADSTELVTAAYSEFYFQDTTLYAQAERVQRAYALTLLSALDLPWEPDSFIRDEPSTREPVDALLRASLGRAGIGYAVVSGEGPARVACALAAVRHRIGQPSSEDEAASRRAWHWVCERCGDADCERHLLARDDRQAG